MLRELMNVIGVWKSSNKIGINTVANPGLGLFKSFFRFGFFSYLFTNWNPETIHLNFRN
jgi:hypothetical protein